ncbi:MAG: hypothetical protein K9J16_18115 [Melioribacteraceae bacterium]|nr:hypothetical protein [Melioribacteraceae bacterium]MCF8396145.1 hypothetical protein [Melioribacteraceae bacterium]MCF8421122.1 hypothetical protein [Melioribacteraceae bacterium]
MDFIKQKRLITIVIVLLVILNIATITLLWLGKPDHRPEYEKITPEQENKQIGRLLNETLGFDKKQIDEYLKIRKLHKEKVNTIQEEIRKTKKEMFSAVLSNDESVTISDSLLSVTENLHAQIEKLTFKHMQDLKALCNEEQKRELKNMIHKLFEPNPEMLKAGNLPKR